MEIICSAVAGMTARLICHPLDTVKTVAFTGFAGESAAQQIDHKRSSSTFWRATKDIWARERFKGFYRGIGVTTLGAAPGVAMYLTSYDYVSNYLIDSQKRYRENESREHNNALLTMLAHTPKEVTFFVSGFCAEAVSCMVWVPIDVSKERLQSQPPSLAKRYRNSWDALKVIHRHEGIFGLYKGYFSTLGSFGPFSAVYFVGYEYFQHFFRRMIRNSDSTSGVHLDRKDDRNNDKEAFVIAMLSGGCANVVASLCTNPLELVKTRLQVQRAILDKSPTGGASPNLFKYHYKGLIDGLVSIAKQEGVMSLWRGVWCRAAFTAPNAALTMSFFEALKVRFINA